MVTSLEDVPTHMVPPPGIEFKPSGVADNETGAWCTESVNEGSRFGPFVGRELHEGADRHVDYRYAWEVYDSETNKLLHIVDATDPQYGNWMRYVNCARYLEEQNLVSIQEGRQIFYRAIRDIEPGEELLTWYSKEEQKERQQQRRKRTDSIAETDELGHPEVKKVRKKPGPKPKKNKRSEVEDWPNTKPESLSTCGSSHSQQDLVVIRKKPGPKPKKDKSLGEYSTDTKCECLDDLSHNPSESKVIRKKPGPKPKPKKDKFLTESQNQTIDSPVTGKQYGGCARKKPGPKPKKDKLLLDNALAVGNGETIEISSNKEPVIDDARKKPGPKPKKESRVLTSDGPKTASKKKLASDCPKSSIKKKSSLHIKDSSSNKCPDGIKTSDSVHETSSETRLSSDGSEAPVKTIASDSSKSLDSDIKVKKQRKRKKNVNTDFVEGNDLDELVDISKRTVERTKGFGRTGGAPGRGKRGIRGHIVGNRGRGVSSRGQGRGSRSRGQGRGRFFRGSGKLAQLHSVIENGNSPIKRKKSFGRGGGRGKNSVRPRKTDLSSIGVDTLKSESDDNVDGISDSLWSLVNETCGSLLTSGPTRDGEYSFEILTHHGITGRMGKKLYKCDICSGVYRHAFSLKRHYLRNHIYCYYLSEADLSNCKISIDYQESTIQNRPKNLPPKLEIIPEEHSFVKVEPVGSDCDILDTDSDRTNLKWTKHSIQTRPDPVKFPGLYRCNICNTLFDYIEDLQNHTQDHPTVPSIKTFACSECDMKFSYKQNLMRHQTVHTGVKPFTCTCCERSFPTSTGLKKHEKVHIGKAPCCKHCKAVFTWRVELKRHMQKLHSEFLHHCSHCKKSFIAKRAYQRHLTTHEDPSEPTTQNEQSGGDTAAELGDSKETEVRKKRGPYKKKTVEMQGGNNKRGRFKFSCTVCKKRFNNYANMCRHRRLAHRDLAKPAITEEQKEECKTPTIDEKPAEPVVVEEEWLPCDDTFFAGVANNIAYNLCNYIDGGQESMGKFSSHIKIKDYKSVAEIHSPENESSVVDLFWMKYNFPAGYEPIMAEEVLPEETRKKDSVDASVKPRRKSSKSNASKATLIKIPEYHRCTVCNCVFSNSESYQQHMQDQHSNAESKTPTEQDSGMVNGDTCNETVFLESFKTEPLWTSYGQSSSQSYHEDYVSSGDDDSDSHCGDHSPFHNYEDIAFGKNDNLKYVCAVCRRDFPTAIDLGFHQYKKHPTIDCSYLEVESNYGIDSLFYPVPNTIGELSEPKTKPLDSRENHSFTCTRCLSHFSTVTRLYIHIINCAPKPKLKTFTGHGKGKFANQRSPVVKNRFKDAGNEKRKFKHKPGEKPPAFNISQLDSGNGKVRQKTFRGCRKRKVVMVSQQDISGQVVRRRRVGGLLYNPRNHVRRREMTEVLERHQCNGCGCKFQTISLLERHIKKCEEKERLRNVKPLKRSASEQLSGHAKLSCRYCTRQFTYLKFLVNHYRDFCHVKKQKLSEGVLTDEDYEEEEKVKAAALSAANREFERRESSEVAMNGEGDQNRTRRGWPRGMKRKKGRKNHFWTYIKKRKLATELNSGDVSSSDVVLLETFEKIETMKKLSSSENSSLTRDVSDGQGKNREQVKNQPSTVFTKEERFMEEKDDPSNEGSEKRNSTNTKKRDSLKESVTTVVQNIGGQKGKNNDRMPEKSSITSLNLDEFIEGNVGGKEVDFSSSSAVPPAQHGDIELPKKLMNSALDVTEKSAAESPIFPITKQSLELKEMPVDLSIRKTNQVMVSKEIRSPASRELLIGKAVDNSTSDKSEINVLSLCTDNCSGDAQKKTAHGRIAQMSLQKIGPEAPNEESSGEILGLVSNHSSDDEDVVLAKFVKPKRSAGLKLLIGQPTPPPIKLNAVCSGKKFNELKPPSKRLTQTTMPDMFPSTKSSRQQESKVAGRSSIKNVEANPSFDEIHKMLDALQSPDPLDVADIFAYKRNSNNNIASPDPTDDQSNPSPESEVSR